jgi:hypothetical protein
LTTKCNYSSIISWDILQSLKFLILYCHYHLLCVFRKQEVPAYERFHSLATPAPPTLSLPYRYKLLAEMFRNCDTVVSMLHNRAEICTFSKLKAAVQDMSKRLVVNTSVQRLFWGVSDNLSPVSSEYHFLECIISAILFRYKSTPRCSWNIAKVGVKHQSIGYKCVVQDVQKSSVCYIIGPFTKYLKVFIAHYILHWA